MNKELHRGLKYMNRFFSTNKTMDMEAGVLGINEVPVETNEAFYDAKIVDENISTLRNLLNEQKKERDKIKEDRDSWKEKYEYLDYFFECAINERNELREAKASLINVVKHLRSQLL